MPSNHTSNDIDLVQPTLYNVQLNRVTKNPPPESWPLPDFTTTSYFQSRRFSCIGLIG